MEDVGTLKAEREVIEKGLKDPITDIGKATPFEQIGGIYNALYHHFAYSP